MTTSKIAWIPAGVLILTAILLPSRTILEWLRELPQDPVLLSKQLAGVALFRGGLVLLGVMIAWVVPVLLSDGRDARSTADGRDARRAMALILLAATALRLYDLGAGLWHDEILTFYKYVRASVGETLTTCEDANQQFLYTLLAQASVFVFGESNWAIRLPAALFGIGSIWALYGFGVEVTGRREALLACLLLTFSYHHVWFSQNARGYTGLLFWTLLTSTLLLRAIQESSARLWVLYAGFVALGMYTNLALLFVIGSHFLIYSLRLIRRRTAGNGLWMGFALAGFLTFLLYSLVLPQIFGAVGGEVSTVPAWKNPVWAVMEVVRGMEIGFAGRVAAIFAVAIGAAGFWSYLRSRPEVAELLMVSVFLCAAVTIALGHHIWPRLFFFGFGFGALIAIRGAMIAGQWLTAAFRRPEKSVAAGTVLCALLTLASLLSMLRAYGPKQDFVGALQYVKSNVRSGDAVVTVGLAAMDYRNFFKTDWVEVSTIGELQNRRQESERTWLLYTFATHVRSVYPEIMAEIQNDFALQREFYGTVGEGTIHVYLAER